MKLEVPGLIPSRGIGIFTLIILTFCSLVFDVQYEFKSVSIYISMFDVCIGFPESSSRRPFLGCPHPSRSRVSLDRLLSTPSPLLVPIALRYLLLLSSRVNSGVICIGSII